MNEVKDLYSNLRKILSTREILDINLLAVCEILMTFSALSHQHFFCILCFLCSVFDGFFDIFQFFFV